VCVCVCRCVHVCVGGEVYGEAMGGGQCGVYVGGEGDANVNTHEL